MKRTAGRQAFAHLHLHTHYSLLDSTVRIPDLVKEAARLDMPAVAITDHGNLFGAFQFSRRAIDAGVRPVIGCEVYVAPGDHRERSPIPGRRTPYNHLVLLAENEKGYRNLTWLVSDAYLRGFYHKPRISKEILTEHSEGLIGLTACLSGEIPGLLLARNVDGAVRAAEEYREIFGSDSFFLEIQDHGSEDEAFVREGLEEVSRRTGVPLVATNDVHFQRREDIFAHKVLIGIGKNRTLEDLHRLYAYNEEFYFKSAEEMYERFAAYPGACERTAEIAGRCHVLFDTSSLHLPSYPVPTGQTLGSYLGEVARDGLERRLAEGARDASRVEALRKRLESELETIELMGFPGYFLVVWDFIRHAKEQGIPVGPGRGSAAGSVVSYALGITGIDPLEHGLLFERFLNPERISMPDIDIDFCQRRREEVIEYVRERYGRDSVCQIATFNILKARSAVRDVGRVMGLAFADVDRIAKLIPEDIGITIEKALRESPDLKEMVEGDEDVRLLAETAQRLEGLARHCGVHAAGVVIAPEPLVNLVPLFRSSHDEVTTQFDKDDVEDLGLLKMDFLGLRTLTVIADTLDSISGIGGVAPDLDHVPMDDPEVYALFSAGNTDGVFQFESSGMKEVLRKVQPRVFADIAALNALYRPGPMQFIDDYSDRRHGRQPITYIMPELEEILSETYGIIVYQEQVMKIAVEIAGFSMAKADTLRKAMGKKKQEIMDREGESFINGAVKKKFPAGKARQLWDQIVRFAQYGFNKSHSVAYAHVAYLTAYLKTHHAAHFMGAMLTSEASNTDKLAQYLSRTQQMGIAILPPEINASEHRFTVEPGGVRFGLVAVKGVGEAAVDAILAARAAVGSFTSLSQFLQALPPRAVNHKVLECLAKAGCFDAFGLSRAPVLENLEQLAETAAKEREQRELGQGFLFDDLPSETLEERLAGAPEAEASEVLAWEKEVLGFYLSGHPLDRHSEQLERFVDTSVADLPDRLAGAKDTVRVGGLITALKIMPIKRGGRNQGRRLAVFELEDQTGSVRVVVFPDQLDRCERVLVDDAAVLLTATLKGEGEHVELMAEDVEPLDDIGSRRASGVLVELRLDEVDQESLEELRELLLDHPGDLPVRFELVRPGRHRVLVAPPAVLTVEAGQEFLAEVGRLVGGGRVELVFNGSSHLPASGSGATGSALSPEDGPGLVN